MNQDTASIILGIVFLGAIGSAAMGVWKMYKRDAEKIHEKYEKKRKEVKPPAEEISLPKVDSTPKLQHPLTKLAWGIAGYWIIFASIIHWLSGDSEVADSTVIAPIALPFVWIWSILSNEKTWYVVGVVFAVWLIYQEVVLPIISRLDRIIELLNRKDR